MNLDEYLKSLSAKQKRRFARRCKTSPQYLYQISVGIRRPRAQLAIAIERESAAAVRCEQLLPDLDWDYLRTTARNGSAHETVL